MVRSHSQDRVLVGSASTHALRGFARLLPGAWQRARQRRELSELDDRMLRDIGISRDDARREAAKPFWR